MIHSYILLTTVFGGRSKFLFINCMCAYPSKSRLLNPLNQHTTNRTFESWGTRFDTTHTVMTHERNTVEANEAAWSWVFETVKRWFDTSGNIPFVRWSRPERHNNLPRLTQWKPLRFMTSGVRINLNHTFSHFSPMKMLMRAAGICLSFRRRSSIVSVAFLPSPHPSSSSCFLLALPPLPPSTPTTSPARPPHPQLLCYVHASKSHQAGRHKKSQPLFLINSLLEHLRKTP